MTRYIHQLQSNEASCNNLNVESDQITMHSTTAPVNTVPHGGQIESLWGKRQDTLYPAHQKSNNNKTSPSFRSLTWLKNLMGSKPRRPGLCPPSRFCRISSIVIHHESAICNPPLCHPLLFCTNLSQVVHIHSTPPVANSYNPISLYHTHRAEANDMICCTEGIRRERDTEKEREWVCVHACIHVCTVI